MDMYNETSTEELFRSRFRRACSGPITLVVICVGACNTLTMFLIFMKVQTKPVIHYYLIALTFWDFSLLISAFFMYCLPALMWEVPPSSGVGYIYLYPYAYFLSNISLVGTVWVLIALAFDRYFALCHPLQHMGPMSSARVKMLLFIIGVANFIYGIPRFLELVVRWNKEYGPYLDISKISQEKYFTIGYKIVGSVVLISLIPFCVLLLLTIRIGKAVRVSAKFRMATASLGPVRLNRGKPERRRLRIDSGSRMQLTLCIKFLFAHFFTTTLDIAEIIYTEYPPTHAWVDYGIEISNLLVTVNSASNTLVFLASSKQLRDTLYRLCTCLFLRRKFSPVDVTNFTQSGNSVATRRPTQFSLFKTKGRNKQKSKMISLGPGFMASPDDSEHSSLTRSKNDNGPDEEMINFV